jgi:hypothetical protein
MPTGTARPAPADVAVAVKAFYHRPAAKIHAILGLSLNWQSGELVTGEFTAL